MKLSNVNLEQNHICSLCCILWRQNHMWMVNRNSTKYSTTIWDDVRLVCMDFEKIPKNDFILTRLRRIETNR